MTALRSYSTYQPCASDERQVPLIAVVDDSPLMRKLIGYTLRRAGFRVHDFADGVFFLRTIREPGTPLPALILLDITMPRMNGYQVARALKLDARTATCAIVMVSRRTGVLDRLKGRLAGACGWLNKPFTTHELLAVVRSALLDHQGQQPALPPLTPSPPIYPHISAERQG